jgi:hypothetical protein
MNAATPTPNAKIDIFGYNRLPNGKTSAFQGFSCFVPE